MALTRPDPQLESLFQRLRDAPEGEDPAVVAALADEAFARYKALERGASTPSGLPYPAPTDPISEGADAIRALAQALETPRQFAYFWKGALGYVLPAAYANIPGAAFTVPAVAGLAFIVKATLTIYNAASGNPKTVSLRMMEGGAAVGTAVVFSSVFITGSTGNTCTIYSGVRTPASSGNLTYQVQGACNAASSCSAIDVELQAITTPPGVTTFPELPATVPEPEPKEGA